MLVLSRRQGESLRIGDDIHVTVLGVSGNQVRFGIKAPLTTKIYREEVYQRLHNNVADDDDFYNVEQPSKNGNC